MGISQGDFVKYPRTPHLFGSTGTSDDRHLGRRDSDAFLDDESLIVEEKLDGTNVGIHFDDAAEPVLQCRGHLITEGMHPQYDLFKQWVSVRQRDLFAMLERRLILFGEWLHAKHSIFYRSLPHYFLEFDIYDKEAGTFLDLETRLELLAGMRIETVPVLHRGAISSKALRSLIGPSRFGAEFTQARNGRTDDLMEGLYLRTEAEGIVSGRAKFVRPEFTEKVSASTHWQHRAMIPNELAPDADLWS